MTRPCANCGGVPEQYQSLSMTGAGRSGQHRPIVVESYRCADCDAPGCLAVDATSEDVTASHGPLFNGWATTARWLEHDGPRPILDERDDAEEVPHTA